MDAKVTWEADLNFVGLAESGFPIRMSSPSGPETGAGPVEVVVMALAACTAMDVISILQKKQERVTALQVLVHADRATSYPQVITAAELEYIVTGHDIREASVRRAIELSVQQYCPVHAMLSRAFSIGLKYSILQGEPGGRARLVVRDQCDPRAPNSPPDN